MFSMKTVNRLAKTKCSLVEIYMSRPTSIETRLAVTLSVLAGEHEHGFYAQLERETGVSAQRWRKVERGLQRPTADMIEAAAKKWPQYVLWITTGITFAEVGQIRPALNEYRKVPRDKPWTSKYMKARVALLDYCLKNGIDEEFVKEGDVPSPILEAIGSSRKMCIKETLASFDDPSLNWEVFDNNPNDEECSAESIRLPNFIPNEHKKD